MSYLVVLRRPGVEGPAEEEFSYHTAKGPHVNGLTERQAQNDLWSPGREHTHTHTVSTLDKPGPARKKADLSTTAYHIITQ